MKEENLTENNVRTILREEIANGGNKEIEDKFGTPDIIEKDSVRTITKEDLEKEHKTIYPSQHSTDTVLTNKIKDLRLLDGINAKSDLDKEQKEQMKKILENFSPDLAKEIDNPDTLSDKDIDKMLELFKNLIPEEDKKDADLIQEIQSSDNKEKLESEIATVEASPVTRELKVVEEKPSLSLTKEDIKNNTNKATEAKDTIKDIFLSSDLTDADSAIILNIILRYKAGENFSIYNAFPEPLKQTSRALALKKTMAGYHEAARDIIKMIINSLNMNEETDKFQKDLKEILGMSEMTNEYNEDFRETMEVKLKEKANEIKDSLPEKAELLNKISQAFTDSYTFIRENEFVDAKGSTLKRILKKDKKKYKRIIIDINHKYEYSKDYNIHNILDLVYTLNKLIEDTDYTIEDIQNFVIIYYELTKNYKIEAADEHVFMYYTINNILNINFNTKDSEFNNTLLDNAFKLFDKIRSVIK